VGDEIAVALCVPVTSPLNDPVKFVELPLKLAVIVPAEKLPLPSLFTITPELFAEVALLAAIVAAFTDVAVDPPTFDTTVAACVPITSPDNEPLKFVAVVAVVAFPDKLAVIVPAEKLPVPSRLTIVPDEFDAVELLARITPAFTEDAEDPPTVFTVVTAAPGPVPLTSPTKDVIFAPPAVAIQADPFQIYKTPSLAVTLSAPMPSGGGVGNAKKFATVKTAVDVPPPPTSII
jgi:hypothetical protein